MELLKDRGGEQLGVVVAVAVGVGLRRRTRLQDLLRVVHYITHNDSIFGSIHVFIPLNVFD